MREFILPLHPHPSITEIYKTDSLLLQLPPELRVLVFETYYNQLNNRPFRYAHHCGYSCAVELDPRCNRCQTKRYLNLLLVCRLTYHECKPIWWKGLASSWEGSLACNARAMNTISTGMSLHAPHHAPLMRLELRFEGQPALRDVMAVLVKNNLIHNWEAQDLITSHGGVSTTAVFFTVVFRGFTVTYKRWCLTVEGKLTELDWGLPRYEQPVQRWLWNRQLQSKALSELGFERQISS